MNTIGTGSRPAITVLAALNVLGAASYGTTLRQNGAASPTTQGWSPGYWEGTTLIIPAPVPPGGVSVSSVHGDMGNDAWSVDDSSTSLGTSYSYWQGLTPQQVTNLVATGWRARLRLRIVNPGDVTGGSLMFIFATGMRRWQMIFGSQADGDPIVQLLDGLVFGAEFVAEGAGPGYHTYELVYDPVAGSADLRVDGVVAISDYTGFIMPQDFAFVTWGCGQDDDDGEGRYASVVFTDGETEYSDVVMQHWDGADPGGESWAGGLFGESGLVGPVDESVTTSVIGPVTSDFGQSAWSIQDGATDAESAFVYYQELSPTRAGVAMQLGWTLSMQARVAEVPDAVPGSVGVCFATGSRRFVMLLGAQADGDPLVYLPVEGIPPREYAVAGGGYHTYELAYDPVEQAGTLFVDGKDALYGYAGLPASDARPCVAWGSLSALDTGEGRYSFVQFASLYGGEDSDGDGMADRFEQQYFLDPESPADGDEDRDLDSLSNAQEYIAQTNPNGADSVVAITKLEESTTGLRILLPQTSPGCIYEARFHSGSLGPNGWERFHTFVGHGRTALVEREIPDDQDSGFFRIWVRRP